MPQVPPPVPVPVIPVYDPLWVPPARPPFRWSAALTIVALVLAAGHLAGMVWLKSSLTPAGTGAPTTQDYTLGCMVFPLLLVAGFFLVCLSVVATVLTPGILRGLGVLALLLNAAAFVLAFPGK
jgi:hypothetical protein